MADGVKSMRSRPHWLAVEVKRVRLQRALTLKTLGLLAGVSPNAIGAFENGHNQMHLPKIERILAQLGYEIDIHEL